RGELRQAALDQVDAGGLERLEKPRRQPERDAVAVPEFAASAGGEAQRARVGQWLAIQVRQQCRRGLVIAHEGARIDVAIADPMLQRYPPLPAGGVRRGARV